jgi:ubiquinol-cytochrome c reductase iron-sulfur subunit
MTDQTINQNRRMILASSVALISGIGIGTYSREILRFLDLDDLAGADPSNIMVDMSHSTPGELTIAQWKGKPVFVLHRTIDMLSDLKRLTPLLKDPYSETATQQPFYTKNGDRSIRPQYLIVMGVCTNSGCDLEFRPQQVYEKAVDWPRPKGGFFCTCDASSYDLAGRVMKGDSLPTKNLLVPPHRYISDTTVIIGSKENGA